MSNWKCNHCKHDNDKHAKNCRRCNAHHSHKEDKHDDHKWDRHKHDKHKDKKRKKVYTSGVIANTDRAGTTPVAQDLWVSVTNFGDRPVTVKVEVFDWGNPAVSAGLLTPCGEACMQDGKLMAAKRVMVMPHEKVKLPGGKTQHFFADLAMANLLCTPVLSFEVRVTVISKDHDGEVVFNAVSYSNDAAVEPAPEPVDIFETAVPGEEEEEEAADGTTPRTEALILFKDFKLLKDSKKDDKKRKY